MAKRTERNINKTTVQGPSIHSLLTITQIIELFTLLKLSK